MLQLYIPAASNKAEELRNEAEPTYVAYLSLHSMDLLMKGSYNVHCLCKVPGKINGWIIQLFP